MSDYDDELGLFMCMKLNALAATFYKMMGKNAGDDFDFSASTHPEEFGCWNMAVVAYSFVEEDEEFLKYQVHNTVVM